MFGSMRALVLSGLVVVVALASGCGSKPVGTVRGKVTYKDQPVTNGSIIFQSADATVSRSANLGADGTYQIKSADVAGLPPGEYKVAVNPSAIGSGEAPLATQPGQTPVGPPPVPAKYHSIETSDLKATV